MSSPVLSRFHPAVGTWFAERFGAPTEAQEHGWASILDGKDTLIMAPTGSGKTLAAFLAGLDKLVRRAQTGGLDDHTRILYISPLKALGVDIERNLDGPLSGIGHTAPRFGLLPPPISTAVRTGDTTQNARQKMLRTPPHVLITTPESVYLLLTSAKGRSLLGTVETVIVDEIHALHNSKRGAHLAISLERLDALVAQAGGARPQRIGLSATANPPSEIAAFLTGYDRGTPRPCTLVDAGRKQPMDVSVEVPKEPLSAVAPRTAWDDVYERIVALVADHKTTLVFVPSRRLAERVAHDLELRLGEGVVAAHHGALSKTTRESIERRLADGALRAVVATASLELGIDVGAVELVCQISSPRSVAVLRQRIGRAHHRVGGVPKGRVFALTRDDLLECAAAVRAMRAGVVDKVPGRAAPLDVLAQQLVAECGSSEWGVDELYALVTRAAPYHQLSRDDYGEVVDMLADGISTRRGRSGAHLHLDRVHGKLRGRRGARLAALTSGGAIPDKADYRVIEEPSGNFVGTLDEDFAIESMAGDIFLLGSTSWRVRRVTGGEVRVEDAHGLPPSIPFWNGEGLARTIELSEEVSSLREAIAAEPDDLVALEWLERECGLDRAGAEQALAYVREGVRALGAAPTHKRIIAERFFDESGGMQLVVHAPLGARINRAWGLALRKRFCRSFDFELQAAATDDGVLLSLGPQHSFPLDAVFQFLSPNTVRDCLEQAILQTPLWETRWRWNSTRSLAVLRSSGGKRTPPHLIRMRAADLLAAVFPAQAGCQDNHGGEDVEIPDHPLCNETMNDCLHEATDLDGLTELLGQLQRGELTTLARDTVAPSVWAHAILNANPYAFLDDAPLEERRSRAVATARAGELKADDLSALDPAAIASVVEELQPEPRDADELHDLLCTAILVAPRREWQPLFDELVATGRAATLGRPSGPAWVAAEGLPAAQAIFPGATLEPALGAVAGSRSWDETSATVAVVDAQLQISGPQLASELAAQTGLPREAVDDALARLEADGRVLQGRFRPAATDAKTEWCERRILQRIHHRTLSSLRERVRPVSAADLMRFLLRWQHIAPGAQLHGPDGVVQVLSQLEGIELQPAAWERDVLARRIANYQPAWLDELCLSGEVAWGRLRHHPPEAAGKRGVTRTGAITLYRRQNAHWIARPSRAAQAELQLGPPWTWATLTETARAVAGELDRRGASFVGDLAAALNARPADVELALWELARAGAVTSDSFAGLRALIDAGLDGRRRAAGRFSLIDRRPGLRPGTSQTDDATDEPPGPAPGDAFASGGPIEWARLLLRRYGVVLRPLLGRETGAPTWRELVMVYRRLEARGEIRGGRFVSGFSGEQFALPEAVEALRALARAPVTAIGDEAQVAAADPLNLVGILTPGPRVPAGSSQTVTYRAGVPVLAERPLATAVAADGLEALVAS